MPAATRPHRPHPTHTRTAVTWRPALLAATLAGLVAGSAAQPVPGAPASGLSALFESAWARQPEAQALAVRRMAAQARRQAADAWTPEPPVLEAGHKTDRLSRDGGAREWEIGIAMPLWLPGERRGSAALADAEAGALESRARAARLRLAGQVREAWWAWQRSGVEVDIARGQHDGARRIAADVVRRVQAGDLARADQHQADGAVAAAEAALAAAEASAAVALQQLHALAGGQAAAALAAPARRGAEPEPPADQPADAAGHPLLAELQDRATAAAQAAALAATQARGNPELSLATTRERGAWGERPRQTLTLALRLPFGGGPRHDSRLASAQADAVEAQAQLALEQARLQAGREGAAAQLAAARLQLAAAERRATLARETRGFVDKAFRLGESDLPGRLRVEREAAEADRQAARSRIDLAAAVSTWRQALGLLPQ